MPSWTKTLLAPLLLAAFAGCVSASVVVALLVNRPELAGEVEAADRVAALREGAERE